ncbi:hypothetical protein BSK56_08970 [Paenibacillus borealis]|uniref:Tyr recombinase domain-containing protein n=1 Tax=Paenibacillus borealis TaxID=160799 RepID=A0ABX3HJ60_PAEBO|nr:hypothetical protein [Paenibacillus borealis]OMD49474.1 hypothetical protein BSK56_08970 [Paenibacillus borealis]
MGVVLEERQSNPEINEDQSDFILQYMRADKDKSFITIQVQIMIKLFLLYGFSYDRLRDLQIGNYLIDERKLEINYQENRRSSLFLEVPFNLHKEIEIYLKIRSLKHFDNKSFFVNSKGNSITHSFPAYYLNLIKDEYFFLNEGEHEIRNPFTPTGISKYAVINMILKGVNQSVIIDLTGFKMETYMYCQQKVDELKELNRNRYINHMIRGIATFELI